MGEVYHEGTKGRFNELMEYLSTTSHDGDAIHLRPDAVRVGTAERDLSPQDQKALEALESLLRASGATPPTVAELQKEHGFDARLPAFASVLEEKGSLVRVTESLLYHREALEKITAALFEFLRTHDVMTMADFKDMSGISRKYAVPLLEYFDRQGGCDT